MSVRLSDPSIDKAMAAGGFAAEVGRGQQISIDSWCCRPIKEVLASFFVIIIIITLHDTLPVDLPDL